MHVWRQAPKDGVIQETAARAAEVTKEKKIMSKKLWGGRFTKAESKSATEFNASIDFDRKMYRQDIEGSRAHAAMLAKQGIITQEDAKAIDDGLVEILTDIEEGKIEFTIENEDIHMNTKCCLY